MNSKPWQLPFLNFFFFARFVNFNPNFRLSTKFEFQLRHYVTCYSIKECQRALKTLIVHLPECPKCLRTLSIWVLKRPPSALQLRKCPPSDLNALCMPDLLQCDWNKILSMKTCFMYMNNDMNGREDFEELNFEMEFAKLDISYINLSFVNTWFCFFLWKPL